MRIIDTAGYDDEGDLGSLRVAQTKKACDKTDIALILLSELTDVDIMWINYIKGKKIPVILVVNKIDLYSESELNNITNSFEEETGKTPVLISCENKQGKDKLIKELIRNLPEDYDTKTITGNLVKEGDTVLLVMPQDIAAPKGRLILPQVQTTRELLDKKCIVISVTEDKLKEGLDALKNLLS